ncbi:hypothetical protein BLOT_016511, partial [Blomia tropicalis]
MHKNTYLTTFLLCLFGYEMYRRKWRVYSKESTENGKLIVLEPELEIPNLPIYSMEQVSKHINAENGIWIVYKAGVQHKTQQVFELLESFRIGNLREEDRLKPSDIEVSDPSDEYIPERNPESIIYHDKPFNAETPSHLLMNGWLTSNNNFFIRNHLSVPEVDIKDYELEIDGLTLEEPIQLTLDQIKTLFPKHSVTSVVQCARNRRDQLNTIKEVKGISWGVGAIDNAQWTGAKLVDILQYCGVDMNDPSINHVQFKGLDLDATSTPYGASALNPMNEFICAYEMNGEPIPADHGFPIRLIAPSVVGARNVKWLGLFHRIWIRQRDEFARAHSIQQLPIQSAICTPKDGQPIAVQWKHDPQSSRGGRAVIRVDLTTDNGRTWHMATLEQESNKPVHHTYSWTLWKIDIPLSVGQLHQGNTLEFACRAFDSSYNAQSKQPDEIWNFRRLLNNSWHRIKVQIA